MPQKPEVVIRIDYENNRAYLCVSAVPAMQELMESKYGAGKSHGEGTNRFSWEMPITDITVSFDGI